MSARLPHALRERRRRRARHWNQLHALLYAASWNLDMGTPGVDAAMEVAVRSIYGRSHGRPTREAFAAARTALTRTL